MLSLPCVPFYSCLGALRCSWRWDDSAHGALRGHAEFPAHVTKQVEWRTLRAAMSEGYPSLSERMRAQLSM